MKAIENNGESVKNNVSSKWQWQNNENNNNESNQYRESNNDIIQ